MDWAFAFGKPIMSFKEMDKREIKRENKRTRLPGTIIKDIRKMVTALEIGKETVTKLETPVCDDADRAVSEDIKEHDIQNQK